MVCQVQMVRQVPREHQGDQAYQDWMVRKETLEIEDPMVLVEGLEDLARRVALEVEGFLAYLEIKAQKYDIAAAAVLFNLFCS